MITIEKKIELFAGLSLICTVVSLLLLTAIFSLVPNKYVEKPLITPQEQALLIVEHKQNTLFDYLSAERENENHEAANAIHAVDNSRVQYDHEIRRFGSDLSQVCIAD
ncbi:MAG: hypothetical protein Q4D98_07770 [Planctomycetia bacterium]|nr:hypothetical protein [Planctomycetia bacterium]